MTVYVFESFTLRLLFFYRLQLSTSSNGIFSAYDIVYIIYIFYSIFIFHLPPIVEYSPKYENLCCTVIHDTCAKVCHSFAVWYTLDEPVCIMSVIGEKAVLTFTTIMTQTTFVVAAPHNCLFARLSVQHRCFLLNKLWISAFSSVSVFDRLPLYFKTTPTILQWARLVFWVF